MFWRGRAKPWWLLLLWPGLAVADLFTWQWQIETISRTDAQGNTHTLLVPFLELLVFAGCITTAWLLHPRMGSWQNWGLRRPRLLTAVYATVCLALSPLWAAARVHVALALPAGLLPAVHTEQFTSDWQSETVTQTVHDLWVADALIPTMSRFEVVNVALVAGVVFAAVAVWGRVAGFFIGLFGWVALIVASATPWCVADPYGQCLLPPPGAQPATQPATWAVVCAGAVVLAAVLAWAMTGGAETLGWGRFLGWLRRLSAPRRYRYVRLVNSGAGAVPYQPERGYFPAGDG